MLYHAKLAHQMNIIIYNCLYAIIIFKIKNELDKVLLLRLIKGCILGLVFSIFVYLYLDIQLLKMTVGVIILILTILLIFKLTINRSRNKDFLTGGVSGVLTTSIGVPGPPLLLYFSGAG